MLSIYACSSIYLLTSLNIYCLRFISSYPISCKRYSLWTSKILFALDKDASPITIPELPRIPSLNDIKGNNIGSDFNDDQKLQVGLQSFRENSRKGIESFQQGKLEDAISYLNKAVEANSTQPLQQRGLILYLCKRTGNQW